MKLFIKGDYTKKIPYGYRELAGKMWFVEKDGIDLDISYAGGDIPLQEEFLLSVRLNKWEPNEPRWSDIRVEKPLLSQKYESISLEFEHIAGKEYYEKGECLRILTQHLNVLTLDKRAAYIMALEVATAIDGQISDDDKQSWQTPDEFRLAHDDVLSLSYEEANELSLKEIESMEAIDEPYWDTIPEYYYEDDVALEVREDEEKFKAYLYEKLDAYFSGEIDWEDFSGDFLTAFRYEDKNLDALTAKEYVAMHTIDAIIERDTFKEDGDTRNWTMVDFFFTHEEASEQVKKLYQELKISKPAC